jgi:hypothetical protein
LAFKDSSGTAVIDAVLTDIGRKRMADGTFRPVKFALGDDEVDYSLIGPDAFATEGAQISLSGTAMFEAYGSEAKNIQYGLNTFDTPHSLYRPILKLNEKVETAAQMSGSSKRAAQLYTQWYATDPTDSVAKFKIGRTGGTPEGAEAYYLAANDETANKMREILTGSAAAGAPTNSKYFKFLEDRNFESNKIIIESGLDNIPIEEEMSIDFTDVPGATTHRDHELTGEIFFKLPVAIDYNNRIKYLVKRNYLDRHYFIMADNRFIEKILGPSRSCSSFKNFADGTADINFQTTVENTPITYFNQFDDYYTFVIDGVPNLMFDHEMYSYPSTKFSNLLGPKGTATAINFAIIKKLKANSTATRDYRYAKYGKTDQKLFDATHKFDYIETVIYIVGATTDARIQAPVRIIRYSGT